MMAHNVWALPPDSDSQIVEPSLEPPDAETLKLMRRLQRDEEWYGRWSTYCQQHHGGTRDLKLLTGAQVLNALSTLGTDSPHAHAVCCFWLQGVDCFHTIRRECPFPHTDAGGGGHLGHGTPCSNGDTCTPHRARNIKALLGLDVCCCHWKRGRCGHDRQCHHPHADDPHSVPCQFLGDCRALPEHAEQGRAAVDAVGGPRPMRVARTTGQRKLAAGPGGKLAEVPAHYECHKCGAKAQHFITDCPQRNKCMRCGANDHSANYCPRR